MECVTISTLSISSSKIVVGYSEVDLSSRIVELKASFCSVSVSFCSSSLLSSIDNPSLNNSKKPFSRNICAVVVSVALIKCEPVEDSTFVAGVSVVVALGFSSPNRRAKRSNSSPVSCRKCLVVSLVFVPVGRNEKFYLILI